DTIDWVRLPPSSPLRGAVPSAISRPVTEASPASDAGGRKNVRLILIEDHADFRESVSMVLGERGYECVGEFSTMEDAIEAIRGGLTADLVLSDLGLPAMSGVDGIRKIRELLPVVQLLVLTAFADKAKVFSAL